MHIIGLIVFALIAFLIYAGLEEEVVTTPTTPNSPISNLTPARPPLDAACVKGLYIVDGTRSGPHQNNFMTHLYHWAQPYAEGCTLVKRYYSGIDVAGNGVNELFDAARSGICNDIAGNTYQGVPPVKEIGFMGFSRGAIVAVTLANDLRRHGCFGKPLPASVTFVGLVDPVRTLMPSRWDGGLDAGVRSRVQVIKEQYQSIIDVQRMALWTHTVLNVPTKVVSGLEHGDMNCPDSKPNFQHVQRSIADAARVGGYAFGDPKIKFPCIADAGSTRQLQTS